MKSRNKFLPQWIAAFLFLAGVCGSAAEGRLSSLVDAANYSDQDKEALKTGLAVALPGVATDYVSQQTIDTQIKKSQGDFAATYTLVSDVAQCLEDKKAEFLKSEAFRRVDRANRKQVTSYLADVIDQYRARAFEALLARYDKPVSVPSNIPRSINNADYRELLAVAVRAALLPAYQKPAEPQVLERTAVAQTSVVIEKPVVVEKPVAVAEPLVVEKPVVVEKSVTVTEPPVVEKPVVATEPPVVEKPVVAEKQLPPPVESPVVADKSATVEKPVVVEKPVITEPAIVEKPVVVEKIAEVEKPVVVEKSVEAEKPVVVEKVVEQPVAVEKVVEKPAVEKAADAPQVVEKPVEKPVVPGKEYTIEVGDSLALLGRLNKVPPAAIVEANPGLKPTQMRVGQVIIIPTSEAAAAKSATATTKQVPLLTSK